MFKAFISALFSKDNRLTPHHILGKNFGQTRTTKNDGGFTLIELVVVMAIISIMTAVVLVNYRPGGQQLALDRSVSKLAQDLRRAQEMAMSPREEGGCGPGFPGEYGIRLSRLGTHYPGPNRVALFANCCDDPGEKGEYDNDPMGCMDSVLYVVEFESEVEFYGIQYYQGGGNPWVPIGLGPEHINIIFSPPDPERTVYTTSPVPDMNDPPSGRHRLRLNINGKFRCVYVNRAGLIYIDECS